MAIKVPQKNKISEGEKNVARKEIGSAILRRRVIGGA